MITQKAQALIVDFMLERVSEDRFLQQFPVNPRIDTTYVLRELEDAFERKDYDQVAHALLLIFRFSEQEREVNILCKLILESWHFEHENMASLLQDLKDPGSVDCLYQTALTHFAYLDYDDNFALAVKCIWALGDINTEYAKEKLRLLAHSDNTIIRRNALKQLYRHRNS